MSTIYDKWSIDMETNKMRANVAGDHHDPLEEFEDHDEHDYCHHDYNHVWWWQWHLFSKSFLFFILNFSNRNPVTNVVLCQFLLRQLAVSENSTRWSALYEVSGKHTFRCLSLSNGYPVSWSLVSQSVCNRHIQIRTIDYHWAPAYASCKLSKFVSA